MISPSHPTEPAAVSLFREAVTLATSTHRQAVTSTTMLGAACVICRIAGATTLEARAHELATKALSQSSRALASALGLHKDAAEAMATITHRAAVDAADAFSGFQLAGIDPRARAMIQTAPKGDPLLEALATASLAAVGAHGMPCDFSRTGDTLEDLQASLAAMDAALAAITEAVAMIDRLQRAGDAARRIIRGESSAILYPPSPSGETSVAAGE